MRGVPRQNPPLPAEGVASQSAPQALQADLTAVRDVVLQLRAAAAIASCADLLVQACGAEPGILREPNLDHLPVAIDLALMRAAGSGGPDS